MLFEVVVECLCNTGMKQQDVESMKSLLLYQLNMYIILSRCVGDTLTLSEVRLFLNIKYGTFGNIDLSYLYVTPLFVAKMSYIFKRNKKRISYTLTCNTFHEIETISK